MATHSVSRETPWRELTAGQRRQIASALATLASDDYAPTAVRSPERATDLHVADSLAALDIEAVRTAGRIVDLGSGAGFPGVAIAIARPDAHVSLIESQRRHCEFLERLCDAAEVENASVVWTRAEEWREGMGRQDVALARALAAQPVVLEYAAPLLRVGGALVDWRGRRSREQEQAAQLAASTLGLRMVELRRVAPFPGASDRHLHVFVKVGPTPSRFPRRPGVARKRPLGG